MSGRKVEGELTGIHVFRRPTQSRASASPTHVRVYDTPVRLEIASWTGAKPLWFYSSLPEQPPRLPYCHFLTEADCEECRDNRPNA